MSLKSRIASDMKEAMRNKETVRLETIRLLRAAVQRKEVDEKIELDDDGLLLIVQKLVKQCQDAANQFEQGGRDDLASKEYANIEVLKNYLPEPLSDEKIAELIDAAIAESAAASMKDMGKVMGIVSKELAGQADGKTISTIVRTKLSS